jgi:hypothetical protein
MELLKKSMKKRVRMKMCSLSSLLLPLMLPKRVNQVHQLERLHQSCSCNGRWSSSKSSVLSSNIASLMPTTPLPIQFPSAANLDSREPPSTADTPSFPLPRRWTQVWKPGRSLMNYLPTHHQPSRHPYPLGPSTSLARLFRHGFATFNGVWISTRR